MARHERAPGHADPMNPLVPSPRWTSLHFARFVMLDDATTGDIGAYGVTPPTLPAFAGVSRRVRSRHATHSCATSLTRAGEWICGRSSCTAKVLPRRVTCDSGWTRTSIRPRRAMSIGAGAPCGRCVKSPRCRSAVAQLSAGEPSRVPRRSASRHPRHLRRHIEGEVAAGRLVAQPGGADAAGGGGSAIAHKVALPSLTVALLPIVLLYAPVFALSTATA